MLRVALSAVFLLLPIHPAVAMEIFVLSPKAGKPVFGTVEVTVEVLSSEPISSIEIRLDGVLVGQLVEPPYTTSIDLGQDNASRTIEITAIDSAGARETRSVTTGVIPIDDRVDLELQQLYVTATRNGERVLDLTEHQFAVVDAGIRQKAVTFERGDIPLTAVLLVDSSSSMEGDALASALAGARAFIETMGPLDEAKVIVFSDRLLATTPFTEDPDVVSAVMDQVEPTGSTSINDHLYLALQELDIRQGRRVIILLSDGVDVDSVLDMADVEWKAGHVQSVIYWIRPSTGADPSKKRASVWRTAEAQLRETDALATTVGTSGGRVHSIEEIDDAADAFRAILSELRDQYVIGYYPSRDLDDGTWHTVLVRVDEPDVDIRVRGGYYDDEFQDR
jgi:Ca-activated chloride channel family protein